MAFVVTAVATAVELGTVAAIATAVAEVGMAMQVVGAITHDKTLSKWGGYLSIAGGVTSLAAGAFGAAAGAAGTAADAAGSFVTDSAAKTVADGVTQAATDTAVDAATDAAGSSVFDSAGNLVKNAVETTPIDVPTAGSLAPSAADATGAASGTVTPSIGTNPTDIANTTTSGASSSTSAPSTSTSAPQTIDPTAADISKAGQDAVVNGSSGTYDQNGNFVPSQAHAGAVTASSGGSIMDMLKHGIDSTSQWFKNLSPQVQAEVTKSLLAIPGGIQAQKNKAAELAMQQQTNDINQQKANQTSYGSQVPTFGIINTASKGG